MMDASMHRVSSGSTGHLDAAIVGGGLMGAMVAFDLASAGMRVVLLWSASRGCALARRLCVLSMLHVRTV